MAYDGIQGVGGVQPQGSHAQLPPGDQMIARFNEEFQRQGKEPLSLAEKFLVVDLVDAQQTYEDIEQAILEGRPKEILPQHSGIVGAQPETTKAAESPSASISTSSKLEAAERGAIVEKAPKDSCLKKLGEGLGWIGAMGLKGLGTIVSGLGMLGVGSVLLAAKGIGYITTLPLRGIGMAVGAIQAEKGQGLEMAKLRGSQVTTPLITLGTFVPSLVFEGFRGVGLGLSSAAQSLRSAAGLPKETTSFLQQITSYSPLSTQSADLQRLYKKDSDQGFSINR